MADTEISILTPSFGYARFIPDAVESVRAQANVSVEHVIVDGNSSDGTVEFLRSVPDIIWISEPDSGQSDALNKALALASGPIVGWLNADEFYLKDGLQRVAEIFKDPSVDVVYGDSLHVDEFGQVLRLVANHRFDEEILQYCGCYIPSCSFFVRRRLLDEWSWDVNASRIMDWDLYLQLASRKARFQYSPEPFGAFRVHERRITAEPLPLGAPERARVLARYGLSWTDSRASFLRRRKARIKRVLFKIKERAYRRQRGMRQFAGTDARWWLNGASGSDGGRG
jgi:glycosyltransferase involved in cell wall biosynthesis